MGKRIVIVRPYGYYGGTLVLDVLCKLLREKGIDARIFYIPDFPQKNTCLKKYWKKWRSNTIRLVVYKMFRFAFNNNSSKRAIHYRSKYEVSMSGLKTQFLPFFNRNNTIVIYPEVVYGNPLKAKNVVRWFLYFNRYQDDPDAFGKDDFFICYRDIFNDWKLNPKGLQVVISYFDKNKYKQTNFGKREGCCYVLRKGAERNDLPKEYNGPIIDSLSEEDKVKVLNEKKYCYFYDTQTFYSNIAAVCGCIPIIILEKGKTKKDYLGDKEIQYVYGRAYGDSPEEVEYAVSTKSLLLKKLDYSISNEENVNKFIRYVGERFGNVF